MLAKLRKTLAALERPSGIEDDPAPLPFGIAPIDTALGGGLCRGALHEIAAASEPHLAAATGFALGVSTLPSPSPRQDSLSFRGDAGSALTARPGMTKTVIWIAQDMALIESGTPCGPGLDVFAVRPERLITVAAARTRDLLWAMEEALRCRAAGTVIGEMRREEIDAVALRRLSLAASTSGAVALLLRAAPSHAASNTTTRWVIGGAPSTFVIPGPEQNERTRNPKTNSETTSGFRVRSFSPLRNDEKRVHGPGPPRFDVHLVRNRRGVGGSWLLEWSDTDDRFILASTHPQPVAAPTVHRPARQDQTAVA